MTIGQQRYEALRTAPWTRRKFPSWAELPDALKMEFESGSEQAEPDLKVWFEKHRLNN